MCLNTFMTRLDVSDAVKRVVFQTMMLASSAEGGAKAKDGWGVCFSTGMILKSEAPFFVSGIYGDYWMSDMSHNVMGHVRQSSFGTREITWDNAHPYRYERFVGQHNGFIQGHTALVSTADLPEKSPTTDSYKAFFKLEQMMNAGATLNRELVEEWTGMFEDNSAFVMGIFDKSDRSMHIIRGPATRQLFICPAAGGYILNTNEMVLGMGLSQLQQLGGEVSKTAKGEFATQAIQPFSYLVFTENGALVENVGFTWTPKKRPVYVHTPATTYTNPNSPSTSVNNSSGNVGGSGSNVVRVHFVLPLEWEEAVDEDTDTISVWDMDKDDDGETTATEGVNPPKPSFQSVKDTAASAKQMLVSSGMGAHVCTKHPEHLKALLLLLNHYAGGVHEDFLPCLIGAAIGKECQEWKDITLGELCDAVMIMKFSDEGKARLEAWNRFVPANQQVDTYMYFFGTLNFVDDKEVERSLFREAMMAIREGTKR